MESVKQPWIDLGYEIFAYEGPLGLKVERLAKGVGKNKSSFYHHFADLDVFTIYLLEHHLDQAKILAKKESACEVLDDFIEVIIEHGNDLLFNRQLRIHRENEEFTACFAKVNELSVPEIVAAWAKILGLTENTQLTEMFLHLVLENFFVQLTGETLNRKWLENYFQNIIQLVKQFKKTGRVPALNASV